MSDSSILRNLTLQKLVAAENIEEVSPATGKPSASGEAIEEVTLKIFYLAKWNIIT